LGRVQRHWLTERARHLKISSKRDGRSTVAFMEEVVMNGIIYLVGLIVIIMAILSFLGLR
jgi:hypothetical protein